MDEMRYSHSFSSELSVSVLSMMCMHISCSDMPSDCMICAMICAMICIVEH